MYEVLKAGGFTNGGLNFDAKARRGSYTPEDIFYSYIAGMDSFALGLRIAAKIIEDGRIDLLQTDMLHGQAESEKKSLMEKFLWLTLKNMHLKREK